MRENRSQISRKLSRTVKKYKLLFVLCAVLLFTVGFLYFPHNVKSLLYTDDKTVVTEIIRVAYDETDSQEFCLNAAQQNEVKQLFASGYARRRLRKKDYVNSSDMGYLILLSDNQSTIYFLSSDIISIDGVQYQIYGTHLSTQFRDWIDQIGSGAGHSDNIT